MVKQRWLGAEQVLFFSDFHIGAGDQADDFKKQANDRMIQMLSASQECAMIYLGDTLELLENPLEKIVLAHRELFERWTTASERTVFLPGNHDLDASALAYLGFQVSRQVNVAVMHGRRALLLHGHQFDRFNPSWTGDTVSRIIGQLERVGVPGVGTALGNLWGKVQSMSHDFDQDAAAMAKRSGCDLVFMGHTHYAHTAHIDGVDIYNTGTWRTPPYTYALWNKQGVSLGR